MEELLNNSSAPFPGMNISAKEFKDRFKRALRIPFHLKNLCSPIIAEFVSENAAALGCSEKAFFYPFLSCVAACMGTESFTEVTSMWHEPPIIWSFILLPITFMRINVAEYLKKEMLIVEKKVSSEIPENTKTGFKKFIFDTCTLDELRNMLELSNGHGFAIYNDIGSLHKYMTDPKGIDIMQRLHKGNSLFTDSRVKKMIVNKTRVSFSVVSTPVSVQETLNSIPFFNEIFFQCFLITCAEENLGKFEQLSTEPHCEKLKEIFYRLIKLHFSTPIIYNFSAEAKEKLGKHHDELGDKAKRISRKNLDCDNVFTPCLSYFVRLSCILHVLENILESITHNIPISHLMWNIEIGAATVLHAQELLGHIIQERNALMEDVQLINLCEQ